MSEPSDRSKSFWKRVSAPEYRLAWATFIVCFLLAVFASNALQQQAQTNSQQQFEQHVRALLRDVSERLRQHEQVLLGGEGLFEASKDVDRGEWRAYVSRLKLADNYPGILGLGFSKIIQPQELNAHIAEVRAEGFPNYTVRPPGERALYTSIIFLEPFTGRNLAAFGFDMFSEATRNKAMTRAAESGQTAISGKVKLVQENQGPVQAGFLMYVPVYRKLQPLNTAEERLRALSGFVYSPYRMNDLMRVIAGLHAEALDFKIFGGTRLNDDASMFNSEDERAIKPANDYVSKFVTQREIQAYGETWTLQIRSRPEFTDRLDSRFSAMVLVGGALIGALLSLLMVSLVDQRQRALALAKEMTVDIRRNEEKLRTSEARFDRAIRGSKDGLWELNLITGEIYYSPRFHELMGVDDGSLGNSFAALDPRLHPDDRPSAELAMKNHLQHGAHYDVLYRMMVGPIENKEWRWFNSRAKAERDDMGVPLRMAGFISDVTERIEAEKLLRQTLSFETAILDNAAHAIIATTVEGTITVFNAAAEKMLGYTAVEMISLQNPAIFHVREEIIDRARKYSIELEHVIQPGFGVFTAKTTRGLINEDEWTFVRKDGSRLPVHLSISAIKSATGETVGYLGMAIDISERKRIDQMKTEFVSTVSHELRTPLTSISGSLGLITGGALGEIPAMMRPMLDIAHKNSLRLSHLINDLLDMEKLVAGKLSFDLKVQPLMPLVEQCLESIQAYGEQYKVAFVIDQRADDVQVRVDGSRLQQVLANFLSNAAKYSPANDQVSIRVSERGNVVRVDVIDHGPGIPEEFRARIFQKFSQADSSDTRQKGGTGLGLAISKELIERMNGLVGFHSVAGRADHGTCFHFELPVWRETLAAAVNPGFELGADAPRLLVVEDEPDIASLLASILGAAGYRVDIAQSGETALALLARHHYAAVTLDLMLPDRSGVSLLRQMRSSAQTINTPIIMVSAYAEDGKLTIGSEFNVIDWIDKPLDSSRLVAAVARAVGNPSAAEVTDAAHAGNAPRVLHVEDDGDFSRMVVATAQSSVNFDVARSLAEARLCLAQHAYRAVVLDLGLPDGSGLSLIREIAALRPAPAVIVLSGIELGEKHAAEVHAALLKTPGSPEDLIALLRDLGVAGDAARV